MTRYGATPANPAKSASSRGSYLRVSFKKTRETAQAVNGWEFQKALKYLDNVKDKKQAIPFRRFAGSIGRTAQGKEFGVTKARWPVKSVNFIVDPLKNAEANANVRYISLLV
ncbi:Rpl17bp [Lipomyces starkeyi]